MSGKGGPLGNVTAFVAFAAFAKSGKSNKSGLEKVTFPKGLPLPLMAKKWQPWVSGSKCRPYLVVQESTRFA